MSEEIKNPMQCAEFDSMLSDALEEKGSPQSLEGFHAHARICSVCGPLLAEADAGRRWLKSLEEIQPPPGLIQNILVATSGFDTARAGIVRKAGSQVTAWERLRDWIAGVVSPAVAVARQPRFAMSFGMAFFSLSISLSLAGVKLSDVRHVDLRPSAIRRSYFEASGRVVKYYENIRFVYEIESRVRDFKRATVPAEETQPQEPPRPKDNTKVQPDRKQDRNYSQGDDSPILAGVPDQAPYNSPVVSTATDRRFS